MSERFGGRLRVHDHRVEEPGDRLGDPPVLLLLTGMEVFRVINRNEIVQEAHTACAERTPYAAHRVFARQMVVRDDEKDRRFVMLLQSPPQLKAGAPVARQQRGVLGTQVERSPPTARQCAALPTSGEPLHEPSCAQRVDPEQPSEQVNHGVCGPAGVQGQEVLSVGEFDAVDAARNSSVRAPDQARNIQQHRG